ncbi:MAG TPA: carboxy-S-adenosyl-L-methionine synthase CmoA [Tepidisphaeraceae bacterium]|jgi:tRNA (cmo5U34)-methyltransferase
MSHAGSNGRSSVEVQLSSARGVRSKGRGGGRGGARGGERSGARARSGSASKQRSGGEISAGSVDAGPDKVFASPRARPEDFSFNKQVTAVFDDMLDRSVPLYQEIQRMVAELVVDFAQPGTNVYDLGCSTCNPFLNIDKLMAPDADVRFVGVDDAPEMLEKARTKLAAAKFRRPVSLEEGDLNAGVQISNASVVMLVLTLQFIRPLYRERLVQSIYRGMQDNGCLIVVEKVLGEHSTFNRLFIKHYYEMKMRNGYSELEIAQKREALENVLVPYRLEENKELLRAAGFRHVDVFFKWYNFCGLIALK